MRKKYVLKTKDGLYLGPKKSLVTSLIQAKFMTERRAFEIMNSTPAFNDPTSIVEMFVTKKRLKTLEKSRKYVKGEIK